MRAPCSFGASSGRRCRGFGIGRRRAGRRQVRLSFDDDNGHWCHCRRRRGRLLLVHDGEGDVEGSLRLAEEVLRQLDRRRRRRWRLLRVQEEERLVELDELVHLRYLPHRSLTVRHASHRPEYRDLLLLFFSPDMDMESVLTHGSSGRALYTRPASVSVCVGGGPDQRDYQSAWNSIAIRGQAS